MEVFAVIVALAVFAGFVYWRVSAGKKSEGTGTGGKAPSVRDGADKL